MKTEATTCVPQRISRFLDDSLSPQERTEFEQHLDWCNACRSQLEHQAAEPRWWHETRQFLSSVESLESESAASDESFDSPINSILKILAPTDDPRMLGRLGCYEIAGVVGHGGMGVVLKGLDLALNRFVAIKVLTPHLAISGSARQRFAREAQAAAAVVHDNVIAIHGVDEWNGHPYLVMPYLRGESLQRRIDDHGPLSVAEILRISNQTAAGLSAAHAQGIVHRDIKPANILLEDNVERVKITDFGLARAMDDASLTRTGVIAGTPQYMSPEQALGNPLDARSDLFSLGSVMYTMCTGHPPFRAENSYGVLRRITDTPQRAIRDINVDIPQWLTAFVDKLLAKQPDARFESAAVVADLLEQCLAHVQQPTQVELPESVQSLVPTIKSRRSTIKPIAIGVVTLLVAVVAYSIWSSSPKDLSNSHGPVQSAETTASSQPLSESNAPDRSAHGSVAPLVSPSLWDDGVADSIANVIRDVDNLDLEVQGPWVSSEPMDAATKSIQSQTSPVSKVEQ